MHEGQRPVNDMQTLLLRDFLELPRMVSFLCPPHNMGREKRVGLYRLHICDPMLPTK